MTPFQTWVQSRYELLAAQYRNQLQTVVDTSREYAKGNHWEPKHTQAGIACLPETPILGKYEGEVTQADREWFATCLKPMYGEMHKEACEMIRSLEQVKSASL